MFERYTERARRVIFFARYEASQFGSTTIETEHLLLGLIREDKNLTNRFLRNSSSIESIRKEIEGRTTIREKVSTSIDLPLSNECKRILAYAAEEAERLNHRHIGTEHLLLGILREEKCVAAEILHERGLRLVAIREELARSVPDRQALIKPKETPLLSEFSRDLTQAAMDGVLDPLVGRDAEIDRVIQILCRRTKNNPVLIGDPGVGKTAIVEGLAQRIVDGEVPSFLADKRILVLDLSLIVAGTKYRGQFEERLKTIMKELVDNPNTVVFIDELHTLVGAGSAEGSLDAANILKPALSRGEIQCIGATTPAEYPQVDREGPFARTPLPGREGWSAQRKRSHPDPAGREAAVREVPHGELHRRSDRRGRVSLEPLYSRSLPAGQGHRSSRRSRRAREAAPGDAASGDDGHSAADQVHRRSGWKAPSRARISKRRSTTRTRNSSNARTCAMFARSTTSAKRPAWASSPRPTSKTSFRAGPAFR